MINMIKVILPQKISLNPYVRAHWTKQHKIKESFHYAVKEAIQGNEETYRAQVRSSYTYYLKGNLLDWDNTTAMTKIIQDNLVREGVFEDDKNKCILGGSQYVYKSKEDYSYVEITHEYV